MKILVTGAGGFIGYHLCERLIQLNYEVVGLDNNNNYYDTSLKQHRLDKLLLYSKKQFTFIKGNIQDKSFLDDLFKTENFDMVCNLAAQAGVRYSVKNPQECIDNNITGFNTLLEVCKNNNVKNITYASSSSVYGSNIKVPFSEMDSLNNPNSVYAVTKRTNELMAASYSNMYNMSISGMRLFTVYGPLGRPDMALFLFVKAALNDETIDVYNNGDLSRDFTYIDDTIDGIILVIENNHNVKHEIYNIGNSNPQKLSTFMNIIEDTLNIKMKKNMLQMQCGDVLTTYADITKIKKLGYEAKTDIEVGIKKFIEWYKSYY